MTGLGLPTLKARVPVADSSMATRAPQPGRMPALRGAVRVQVGGHQLGPVQDHAHRRFHHLEVQGPPFADHHVIGVLVDNRVAVLVQGRQQPALADHEGGAPGLLLGQETGGCHGTGEDVPLFDLDAETFELDGLTSRRVR